LSSRADKSYLSVCLMYRDEAPYLREWMAFHRLVGVERFFLYDNGSSDEHLNAIAPFIDDGTAVLHDAGTRPQRVWGHQIRTYQSCIEEHGSESRWIAFIDTDEFLFSPTGRPLPEVLRQYESAPGVGVNCVWFGSSGHRQRPDGLVTESYLRRAEKLGKHAVKSIIDPQRTEHCANSHLFVYKGGALAVNENHEPLESHLSPSYTFSQLRINHYYVKSEEEARERGERWTGILADFRPITHSNWRDWRPKTEEQHAVFNEVYDDAILAYVPALRAELAALEAPARASGGVEP
jgi:hypothetical protein